MQTLITISQFAALMLTMGLAHSITSRVLALNATYRAKAAASKRFHQEQSKFIEPLCDALRQGDHAKANEVRRAAQQHADRF